MDGHKLTITEVTDAWERKAGFFVRGECECHNPDGDGTGRMDWYDINEGHIEWAHEDHLMDVREEQS